MKNKKLDSTWVENIPPCLFDCSRGGERKGMTEGDWLTPTRHDSPQLLLRAEGWWWWFNPTNTPLWSNWRLSSAFTMLNVEWSWQTSETFLITVRTRTWSWWSWSGRISRPATATQSAPSSRPATSQTDTTWWDVTSPGSSPGRSSSTPGYFPVFFRTARVGNPQNYVYSLYSKIFQTQ